MHNSIVDKLTKYKLDNVTVRWIKNYLKGWAWMAVTNGTKSSCKPDFSGIPQGLKLDSVLVKIFITKENTFFVVKVFKYRSRLPKEVV